MKVSVSTEGILIHIPVIIRNKRHDKGINMPIQNPNHSPINDYYENQIQDIQLDKRMK